MKFDELIPLTGALLNFSLALFVLLQAPRSAVARVYFLLGVSCSIWSFGTFWMFRVPRDEYHQALFWARFLQFGVIMIPLTLCHVSFLIAQIPVPKRLCQTLYVLHGFLLLSNFGSFVVSTVTRVEYAWYSQAGPGFWMLTIGMLPLLNLSLVSLIIYRRKLPVQSRRRITPLIIAQTTFVIFGCNDILPILKIFYYDLGHQYRVYPFGSMAVIFYSGIVGYSVLHHQLLEVRVVLNRHIAKIVRGFFLFLTSLCTLLIFWLFHPQGFTPYAFSAALCAVMAGALCAALFFPRLFGEGDEGIERRILGDCFEYQDQVRQFIEGMTWYSDQNVLLDDLHDLLIRVLNLESYQIILRDDTQKLFEFCRSYPAASSGQLEAIKSKSPVFEYFEATGADYLARDHNNVYSRGTHLEQLASQQMCALQAQFCFPLNSHGEPLGLLLIGVKANKPITITDINLLILLVKNMSLMINQIRLTTQILQAQELDLLGRMSRGMAHDLNNLLTPVWTLLQLSAESRSHSINEELLPVATLNIKTMRKYIREALFFSENLRPDIQLGRLDMLLMQAIKVARSNRKEVQIVTDTPGEVLIEMDEVLVERLVANIISNAIDASPPNGNIHVELLRIVKKETNQDWLRIRITDEGEGICKEDLDRVFAPYFTTKNRGDEGRGFGLGLAISRKIVNLHGGNLSITSQIKMGTTVQVDLPRTHIRISTTLQSLPL